MDEVKKLMTRKIITVKKDTPIYDAIDILVENNITGLPVVDDGGHLAGILSEKDVLALLSDLGDDSATVEKFMSTEITSFDENDDLIAICECLVNNPFRRVPILSDGKLAGIISRKDIIKFILEPI